MKPIANKDNYSLDINIYDATLLIRALECYAAHTENGDAIDAIHEAEYLKDLGSYDEDTEIMQGFYY